MKQLLAVALFSCGGAVHPDGLPAAPVGLAAAPQPVGLVTSIAGTGEDGFRDGPASDAQFDRPFGLAVTATDFLVVEYNGGVRRIANGLVSTLAGGSTGYRDGQGASAMFSTPKSIAIDPDGNAYVADEKNLAVRKVTRDGLVSTIEQGTLLTGLAIDRHGVLYATSGPKPVIWKLTTNGSYSAFAGSAVPGHADGNGAAARFESPDAIACDAEDNLFIVDLLDQRVRKVTASGDVTTVAGTGSAGSQDGDASSATFNGPQGIAVSSTGYLYVADSYNYTIRRISPRGKVATIAGVPLQLGSTDAFGADARLGSVSGIAIDPADDLVFGDVNAHKIRKVATAGSGVLVVRWNASQSSPAVSDYTATASAPGFEPRACTTDATTCTIKGLEAGVAYSVSVSAKNALGVGPSSSPVTATPD